MLWWLKPHKHGFISSLTVFFHATSWYVKTPVPRWSFLQLIPIKRQVQWCLLSFQFMTSYLAIPNTYQQTAFFLPNIAANTVMAANKMNWLQIIEPPQDHNPRCKPIEIQKSSCHINIIIPHFWNLWYKVMPRTCETCLSISLYTLW